MTQRYPAKTRQLQSRGSAIRIHQAGLKRSSRGITMFGVLIGIIMLITFALPATWFAPSLVEYRAITHAVKWARERASTYEEIADAFDKQAVISNITSIKGEGLEVLDGGGSIRAVRFSYKCKTPLYDPIGLMITYSGTRR